VLAHIMSFHAYQGTLRASAIQQIDLYMGKACRDIKMTVRQWWLHARRIYCSVPVVDHDVGAAYADRRELQGIMMELCEGWL
jgi:hypothetical protein